MLLGDYLKDRIVNFKILIPICHHQAPGAQEQEIDLADRVVKNLIQCRRRGIAEVLAKAVGADSRKESDDNPDRLPPEVSRNNPSRGFANAGVSDQPMRTK